MDWLFFSRGAVWAGCSSREELCELVVLHKRSCVIWVFFMRGAV